MVFELNKEKLGQLLVAVIASLAVLLGLQVAVEQLDVSVFPEQAQPVVVAVVSFMGSGAVTFIVAFGRNMIGYLRNYFRENFKETYNLSRLYTTWFYYYGILGSAIAFVETSLPPEYASPIVAVMTVIAVVVDFVLSEINRLRAST